MPLQKNPQKEKEELFKLSTLRHSASHILASAILKLFPEARLGIGPSTKDGFYYDFVLPRPLIPEDLPKIEAKMREIIRSNPKFEKKEIEIPAAIEIFQEKKQNYKIELLQDLRKKGEKIISLYQTGNFTDLCRGPHLKSAGKINPKAFKLLKIAGAYWKGDEKNQMLGRVYGTAFNKPESLKKYLMNLEEAAKRDHRKIGATLDLFSFHPEAPGMPFWHPKGWALFQEILKFWRAEHSAQGYREVSTPIILAKKLWLTSGHWDHYKENMYFTKIDKKEFAVKPMNCPGNLLIYQEKIHSYRDFPLKIAEVGTVHRHERAGVLSGLFRVREFTQDDAHVFCTEKQITKEVGKIFDLATRLYHIFGFKKYHIELSTRPKNSTGTEEMWRKAESALSEVLEEKRVDYKVNPGDGAFYGPKIDFHIEDALGRHWQCGTIQVDFAMPSAFCLSYIGRDGAKKIPTMIHRTILGSIERFIGILIEHYAGAFPLWLAPVQVAILPVSEEKHKGYSKEIAQILFSRHVRPVINKNNDSVNRKVRDAEKEKIPYILVIGDEEEKNKTVAVRERGSRKIEKMKLDAFLKMVLEKIKVKA
ncbi:MAG: threonine--tRNA ligase [bacterium]|nr:threonine--tRNA ligase [bacterium]